MSKNKKVEKSHILVESEGTPQTTKIFLVEREKKTELPFILSASWKASVKRSFTKLDLEVITPKMLLKTKMSNVVVKNIKTVLKAVEKRRGRK